MPSVLGTQIDKLTRLRAKRMKKQREVDAFKKEESLLTADIQGAMLKGKLYKSSGRMGTFSLKEVIVPKVDDWRALHQFIRQSDKFELLQKRLGTEAYRELIEDGVVPPGTTPEKIWKATLTTLRSS